MNNKNKDYNMNNKYKDYNVLQINMNRINSYYSNKWIIIRKKYKLLIEIM